MVFSETKFKNSLEVNTINLPNLCGLSGSNNAAAFVFVADNTFLLPQNIMKTYAGVHDQGSLKRIFNYRLSRACRVSGNTFGIIYSVFRLDRKPIY